MLTGGEIMVKCLEAEGVDILFGYPGAAICPFYDALYDSPIRHVLVRSEQNAAHMASGYARASGRPGVCVATSGPGATNLITGIATAYMDSIPIIAITGQVNLEQLGRDVFQEADITGACESFTKHSYLVKSVEDLPRVFEKGFTGYNGREDKKSTGIGLYLCRRVMDRLNHGISIVSRPGQGTLVRLDLSRGRRVVE